MLYIAVTVLTSRIHIYAKNCCMCYFGLVMLCMLTPFPPPPLPPPLPRLPLTSSAKGIVKSGHINGPPSSLSRMGFNKKGTVALVAPMSSEDDTVTHLLRYSDHLCNTSYSNVVASWGGVIIPCTLVWSFYLLIVKVTYIYLTRPVLRAK